MNPAELRSYQLKIERSKGQGFLDALLELMNSGTFPNQLVPSVMKRCDEIPPIILYRILLLTKSEDLYRLADSKQICFSDWEFALLYKEGLPASEDVLCDKLYRCFRNTDPARGCIVEAMKERGGKQSLEYLEVVEYELSDYANLTRVNKEDIVSYHETAAMVAFARDVKVAIDKIEKRLHTDAAKGIEPAPQGEDQLGQGDKLLSRILEYQQKAQRYLGTDPLISCNLARKAAEAIAKEVYERNTTRPADTYKQLDGLLKALREIKAIPQHIMIQVETIHVHGNYGSHDQKQDSEAFTAAMAEPCIKALDVLVQWYRQQMNA